MGRVRSTFAGRLIAAIFLLVLLPTILLGAFVYTQSRSSALDIATNRITDVSAELATRIDAFVINERNLARYGAASREVRDFIRAPRDPEAAAALDDWLMRGPFTSGHDHVADVLVLNMQGTCIASTNASFVGESYGVRPYFQQASAGSDAISDWSIGITSGEPGIYLSSPIRGEFNEVAGVLVVKLETAPIDDIIDQAFDADVRAVLLNEAGVVLAAYDQDLRYQTVDELTPEERAHIVSTKQFGDEELPSIGLITVREDLRRVEPGETVISREYELGGAARIAALTGLESRPWTVAVIALISDIEAAAASVPLIVGIFVALILLYVVFATGYLKRFLVQPIRDLVESSNELAAGRLSVQVPVRGDDEVAQLAAAFNAMATEIRGNTERLEAEVARRTAELEQANQEITEVSITDSLTGCNNRHYLDLQLPREVERAGRYARRLSIMMCDIDFFKAVNDRHGHAAGDEVLRTVGAYLNSHGRTADWVARFGGEEFVIVLPETNLSDAVEIAERTRAGIAALDMSVNGEPLSVTASFGVSTFHMGEDDSAQKIIERSDEALYRSKDAGRNRVSSELD
jgi:diguanylate cyclase (GGDEF)-like protein